MRVSSKYQHQACAASDRRHVCMQPPQPVDPAVRRYRSSYRLRRCVARSLMAPQRFVGQEDVPEAHPISFQFGTCILDSMVLVPCLWTSTSVELLDNRNAQGDSKERAGSSARGTSCTHTHTHTHMRARPKHPECGLFRLQSTQLKGMLTQRPNQYSKHETNTATVFPDDKTKKTKTCF